MNRTPYHLLLIDAHPADVPWVAAVLTTPGSFEADLRVVDGVRAAEQHLADRVVDLIVLDPALSDVHGWDAVRRVHAAAPHVPVLVFTHVDQDALGADVSLAGVQEYLIKGQVGARGLQRSVTAALERQALEDALFVERDRAHVTLTSIGDAVVCTDVTGHLTFLNPAAETITGWSLQEAVGRPMAEVCAILDARRIPIPDPMRLAVARDRTGHLPPNCVLLRRDGQEIPIEDSVAPIHNRRGQIIGAVIVFRDVTAMRAMAVKMSHAAHHDYLTGLPNRLLLHDRASQAIAAAPRHGHRVAVLFLDLDNFKHINDSLGHRIGDHLLQSIARRLVACVRQGDTVSRQGGDEFVVVLADVDCAGGAGLTATRLLHAVAEVHAIESYDLHVTTSIGVSLYPDDGVDADTLIKNADTAMYQAKEAGDHSYQFFTPAMNVVAVARQSIEASLRHALERDEFALHYQPKINLRTGALSGAEALLRWTHPVRGPIAPAEFIPVAEDCGLIVPLGRWVLREACRQTQAWVQAGLSLPSIAVNISAMEFRALHFLEGVTAILDETGLDPRALELELTESVLMKHPATSEVALKALRAAGVQLAIDDFGTGYSSLSYLTKFPVDALKIDQSFIRHITQAPMAATLVTAIIGMGRSLELRVVAEGVERPEQLAFLLAHQCDEAQGYYFGRPMPPEPFATLLKTGLTLAPMPT